MPYLGDYLGQLLSEITLARMQADLETVRIAELYAAHPLLRMMPVPHVRMPDVELDLPVLIKTSEEPRAGQTARGGVTMPELIRKFDEVLKSQLKKAGIDLNDADQKKLRAVLAERLKRHDLPTETSIDVYRVADDFSAIALKNISEIVRKETAPEPPEDPEKLEKLERPDRPEILMLKNFGAELKETVRLEFLKLRLPPPRLLVVVNHNDIREAGGAENLTRLHLKITEQGVEWKTIESEGGSHDRLMPE